MHLLEGLRTRRSVYSFASRPPDLSIVREALDLAVLAPNHHKTRPWRFAVFVADGRRKLSDAFGSAAARLGRPVERAQAKPFEAPVVVLVGATPRSDNPKVVHEEELLAAAAGVQNFILALHARGVGSIWTTGPVIDSSEVRSLAGWTGHADRVIGLIYVGYADDRVPLPPRRDRSHDDVTTWFG